MNSSYFPWSRKEVKELVKRCLSLVELNDKSAVTFYSSLNINDVPPTTIVKFIVKVFSKVIEPWLLNKEKVAEQGDEGEVSQGSAKRAKLTDTLVALEDVATIRCLMTIIALIWDKVDQRLMTAENKGLVEVRLSLSFGGEIGRF